MWVFGCSGWSSRTQFEETWATLLGVLVTQPITKDQEEDPQQEVFTQLEMLLGRKIYGSTNFAACSYELNYLFILEYVIVYIFVMCHLAHALNIMMPCKKIIHLLPSYCMSFLFVFL